jgi:hypothetical protein
MNDNIALVKDIYAGFGRGDVGFILSSLASDVRWTLEGPAILPYAGKRVGPSEVAGFFEALATTQTQQKLTIDEFIAAGDEVITVGRYAARVNATGKYMDTALAHVWTIKSGKITRFLDFADTAGMAAAYEGASAARA